MDSITNSTSDKKITANMFNFDGMMANLGADPFKAATKYETDERFYVLPKDENGEGSAMIAFLPDPEGKPIQRLFKINTSIMHGKQRRFVSEWSPTTIDLPCPFQERWAELYNSGKQEEARVFARSTRFIGNIYVIKDPVKPENEGKIFLLEMSKRLVDKLEQAFNPTKQDLAMGVHRKEIFNPTQGWAFRLVARKQPNDMISYDSSEFYKLEAPIWTNIEDAVKEVNEHCHKLSDFLKPENFKSYDELKQKFDYVTNANVKSSESHESNDVVSEVNEATAPAHTKTSEAASTATSGKNELDDILKDII